MVASCMYTVQCIIEFGACICVMTVKAKVTACTDLEYSY